MSKTSKTFVLWLIIVAGALLLWQVVKSDRSQRPTPEISYSEFLSRVEGGGVSRVTISGSEIEGRGRDGASFRVIGPAYQADLLEILRRKDVEIWFRDTATGSWPVQLLGTWAPLILLAALWFFMIRQMGRRMKAKTEETSVQNIDRIG